MKYFFSMFIVLLLIFSCKKETRKSAQDIIDKTIQVAQIDKVANAKLTFDFRNRSYVAKRNQGAFSLQRITLEETDTLTDILSNNGFERLLNGLPVSVIDSMAMKYSESVNSVHYFSVLPYGLNDSAVNKKRLEDVRIKGKEYYKIQVTFHPDGGGVDFEDVFVYWIGKEDFKLSYLAYLFHVNGGGVRFREVRKEHKIQGIRFVDYNNYKPNDATIDVRNTDKAFVNGELTKVSEINLENLQIEF